MVDEKRLNRTWLCSVLFTDLINYSSQLVPVQSEWKEFFNRSVANSLKSVNEEDRVIIDTGDGAAICFLGDPESAILCALEILHDFKERQREGGNAPRLRLGIHLGPIKLIEDLNGNLNVIGDGINVGQRIMSFADGDQILVSRPYFDVVSRLSEEYCRIFKFEGMRHDKHVREHAIYALVPQGDVADTKLVGLSEVVPDKAQEEAQSTFDPASVAAIEDCLRDCVGPMALHLVRVESRKVRNLHQLCESLADKAVPPNEREKFLSQCRARLKKQDVGMAANSSQKPAAESRPSLSGSGSQQTWDPAFIEKLKLDLTDHIGPVASVVVDRAARKAQSREELLQLLAEHFPPVPKKKR